METANISTTKNELSRLLRKVEAGEVVLITDRDRPVARLSPVGSVAEPGTAWLAKLVRQGVISEPEREANPARLERLPLPKPRKGGDILKVLLEEREEGR